MDVYYVVPWGIFCIIDFLVLFKSLFFGSLNVSLLRAVTTLNFSLI